MIKGENTHFMIFKTTFSWEFDLAEFERTDGIT